MNHQPTGLWNHGFSKNLVSSLKMPKKTPTPSLPSLTALVLGKFLHALQQKGLHLSLDIPLLAAIASTWGPAKNRPFSWPK
jgi:hypothetical protein